MKSGWFVVLCLAVSFGYAAALFPTGSFVYTGRVVNHDGDLVSAEDSFLIQAVSSNGTVLAECKAGDVEAGGMNYRLAIPLSSIASLSAAMPGETLQCVIRSGETVYVSGIPLPSVGGVDEIRVCHLSVSTDSDNDGVPDEYVNGLAGWLEAETGGTNYQALADYDKDGANNYAEYVAGTNPFDSSDKLAFKGGTLSNVDLSPYFPVQFEYVGGRVYAVQGSTNLTQQAGWGRESFRTDPAGTSALRFLPPKGDYGIQTLYLKPQGRQKFFRVLVNPEQEL